MLLRLNRWYDSLKEPWRLLIAIAMVLPLFMLITNGRLVDWLVGVGGLLSIVGFRMVAKWLDSN